MLSRIAQNRLGLVVDFLPPARHAAAGAEAVFLAARSGLVAPDRPADAAAVLDRHGRPFVAGRNPHPARRSGDAGLRTAQRCLRLELGNLPVLDGRHFVVLSWSQCCSSAIRSGRSCGWPRPPRVSARAARSRTSGRAARARCVSAAQAFMEMKSRIERTIEQRTAMLAGCQSRSAHHPDAVQTGDGADRGQSLKSEGMRKDVDEMAAMLEAYLAFARGDAGELARRPTWPRRCSKNCAATPSGMATPRVSSLSGLPVVT